MSRRHHAITRTTLPIRPLWEWAVIAAGVALGGYLSAVAVVNLTSLP